MVMNPPSGGPPSGPTSAGMVSNAMAPTSSLRCVERTRTRRATGVIIAPPMPCRKRASTKVEQAIGKRAGDRTKDEDEDGGAKDPFGAEPVGHPAAQGNEDRQRHHVGRQRQLQRDRPHAEVMGDRGQRGRNDGGVHLLHEQSDGEDHRNDAIHADGLARYG